jgi:hypothetical protein
MQFPLDTDGSTLTFDALGQTLELHDGDPLRLGIAFTTGDGAGHMLGGVEGVLRLVTQEQLEHALAATSYRPPEGAVEEGERAHLIEVAGLIIAISSADYVGGSYGERVLKLQVGPVLLTFDFETEV